MEKVNVEDMRFVWFLFLVILERKVFKDGMIFKDRILN